MRILIVTKYYEYFKDHFIIIYLFMPELEIFLNNNIIEKIYEIQNIYIYRIK